jgi:hypothetical protein
MVIHNFVTIIINESNSCKSELMLNEVEKKLYGTLCQSVEMFNLFIRKLS